MNNPIRNLVLAKIKGLYAKYEESNSINHAATKGSLREQALTEFMIGVLPSKYLVKSGFICDSFTEDISPQLDLIIADKDSMPNFSLDESSSIIPVESALSITEIKSTIMAGEKGAFEQLKKQREVINNLKFDYLLNVQSFQNLNIPSIGIPSSILAFDSKVNEDDLRNWFDKEKNLMSICVIGKFCLARLSSPHGITIIRNEGNHEETMFYIGKQYAMLNELKKVRSILEPNWDKYLQDKIPTESPFKIEIPKT